MTKTVMVGGLPLGGGNPVLVQSMTNTDTRDAEATLKQICALHDAGCDIVRVSVYDEACAEAVKTLAAQSPVPLVADIHFDYRLAIRSAENGIAKLRINPGNIGGEARVRELADCAKAHGIPIRIGVNSGSAEKDLLAKYGGPTAECLVESALGHARMLEKAGFEDIVLSMKSSDVKLTIEAYRLAHERCDYPLHLGVTEAGLPGQGTVKSAIGIGALLADGIGDTIRVSLSGDPLPEAKAAWDILRALNLRTDLYPGGTDRPARGGGTVRRDSAPEGRGDGLHRQRPGRGPGSGRGDRRRKRRRGAVREGTGTAEGAGRSGGDPDRRSQETDSELN